MFIKFYAMRIKVLAFTLLFIFFGCHQNRQEPVKHSKSFTTHELKILNVARNIIKRAYFSTLITLDKNNLPKARLMEPFPPNQKFEIFLATNPNSRKVKEIQHNHTAGLHYIDEPRTGYVSLYGHAFLVTNDSLKKTIWKKGWERFYKNRDKDYMLIRFVPDYLEVISIRDSLNGNPKNWQPSRVNF